MPVYKHIYTRKTPCGEFWSYKLVRIGYASSFEEAKARYGVTAIFGDDPENEVLESK